MIKSTDITKEYFSITLLINKTEVSIYAPSNLNYVQVNYKNAASLAFRGLGKVFGNFEEAKANYKKAAIREAIDLAKNTFEGYPLLKA